MGSAASGKDVVRRLIEDVLNGGHLDVIDDLYSPQMAPKARAWIAPFRTAFPDVHMEIVELVAEGERVVGRFRCSASHTGEWQGVAATGRRFDRVDEVYFLTVVDGRITAAWGIEDNDSRKRQLGIEV